MSDSKNTKVNFLGHEITDRNRYNGKMFVIFNAAISNIPKIVEASNCNIYPIILAFMKWHINPYALNGIDLAIKHGFNVRQYT